MKEGWAEALDVQAEDRILWALRRAKAPAAEARLRLAEMPAGGNWDYLAGEALRLGFVRELIGALKAASSPSRPDEGRRTAAMAETVQAAPGLAERLEREAATGRRPLSPWSPEGRFLVLCASPRMTEVEDAQAARLASGSLKWEALGFAAARCGLTLTLQRSLSRLELDERMPKGLAEVLSRRARGISGRNLRLVRILDDATQSLQAAGVRALLLKETALALSHFGNGRLRSIDELELLVGRGGEEAAAALEARGWSLEARDDDGDRFCLSDQAVTLRLCRNLGLPIPEPREMAANAAARSLRIDSSRWCLSPTDTLLHLCLDLFDGAFAGRLARLCDAREVVRQGGVEWPLLEEQARACRAEPHAALALRLLARLDTSIPSGLIGRLELAEAPPMDAVGLHRVAERNLLGCGARQTNRARRRELRRFRNMVMPGPGGPGLVRRLLQILGRSSARWTGSRRMP